MASTPPGEQATDLSATDARQARPGVPVVWVLVISTLVGAIVVALVWFYFAPSWRHTGGQQQIKSPSQAAGFSLPAPAAKDRLPGEPAVGATAGAAKTEGREAEQR